MIRFSKQNNQLLLIYQADRFNDARWLDDKPQEDGELICYAGYQTSSK